ncbi:MAG: sulfite exporter TauE/SafE family protein [Verrucomicrobiota bacterium]
MTATEILSLTAAAAVAGMVNAIAGGGTLITFPVLLLFGTPEKVANATSTLALVLGMAGSLFGYRNHLAAARIWLWRFVPVSILGGLLGSILLTRTNDAVFAKMVPFLIFFATLIFLAQGTFRKLSGFDNGNATPPQERHHAVGIAILVQIGVAIYGGYFGAGIGILMLASLGFIGLSNIHEMNSLKTILASLINLVASAWFIGSGLIHWPKAAIMTAGALGGYYLGAHFAQRIPQQQVRRIINAIGLTISAVMFYKQFSK